MKKVNILIAAKLAKVAAVALVVSMSGTAAEAQDWRQGLYIKAGGAWNASEGKKYHAGADKVSVKTKDGYMLNGSVGYEFDVFRTELELNYRDNDVKSIRANGVNVPAASGNVDAMAMMVNAYYDLDMGGNFTPYFGAGIGAARVEASYKDAGGAVQASGKDTVFAYQGMAGVEYAVDSRVALYGEYRYFGTGEISVKTAAGNKSHTHYNNHSLGLGIRYSFD